MARPLAIVVLVGLFLATGVAGAAPAARVRLPVTTGAENVAETVTVEKGDHLWKISARRLGPDVPSESVAPYWRSVIDRNIANLRSGDPDLIYPGEVIEMPAISESP